MKEKIEEFLGDFNNRVKNPLIFTFIIVWLYFHWHIVYWLLTFDDGLSLPERYGVLTDYVNEKKFSGLIGYPLVFSFLSLTGFYLIANASQFIKLFFGQKLNTLMLDRFDNSKLVPREELNQEKEKSARYLDTIDKQRNDYESLIEVNKSIRIEMNGVSEKLRSAEENSDKIKKTIDNNISLKNSLRNSFITLLARFHSLDYKQKLSSNIHRNEFLMFDGRWEINYYSDMSFNTPEPYTVNVEEDVITLFNVRPHGKMIDLVYDSSNSLGTLKIRRTGWHQEIEIFHFVRLNKHEFLGLSGDKIVTWAKTKENIYS